MKIWIELLLSLALVVSCVIAAHTADAVTRERDVSAPVPAAASMAAAAASAATAAAADVGLRHASNL